MILALATANDCRNITADNAGFYELCSSYMNMPTTISDKKFLDAEAEKISAELIKLSSKEFNIPKDKIKKSNIKKSCSVMFISRGVATQHRDFGMNIEEIYRDYRILQLIDSETSNEASKILKNIFGFNTVRIFRSAWGLFAIGNQTHNNGAIDFKKITCDDDITKRLNIDHDTCLSVALKTSYKESDLRQNWLNKYVLTEEKLYQQYIPDPLFTHPIIHRDKSVLENLFLIPSPKLFIRAFRQKIFSILLQGAKKETGMGEKLGNAKIGRASCRERV